MTHDTDIEVGASQISVVLLRRTGKVAVSGHGCSLLMTPDESQQLRMALELAESGLDDESPWSPPTGRPAVRIRKGDRFYWQDGHGMGHPR